jgi:hypothetical protein
MFGGGFVLGAGISAYRLGVSFLWLLGVADVPLACVTFDVTDLAVLTLSRVGNLRGGHQAASVNGAGSVRTNILLPPQS